MSLNSPHPGFLLGKTLAGLLELVFEELSGVRRLLLPGLEIFPDEEVREFAGRLLGHLRVVRRVIDIERRQLAVIRFDEFDLDVFAHLLDFLVGSQFPALLARIKMESVDDVQEAGAAEDLLCDAVQTALQVIVHVRDNVGFWHSGGVDQNQRTRAIHCVHKPGAAPHQEPSQEKGREEKPAATAHDAKHLAELR